MPIRESKWIDYVKGKRDYHLKETEIDFFFPLFFPKLARRSPTRKTNVPESASHKFFNKATLFSGKYQFHWNAYQQKLLGLGWNFWSKPQQDQDTNTKHPGDLALPRGGRTWLQSIPSDGGMPQQTAPVTDAELPSTTSTAPPLRFLLVTLRISSLITPCRVVHLLGCRVDASLLITGYF